MSKIRHNRVCSDGMVEIQNSNLGPIGRAPIQFYENHGGEF